MFILYSGGTEGDNMYTIEIETPYGWMSRTRIDQRIKQLLGRKLLREATETDDREFKELSRIRESSIRPPRLRKPGEQMMIRKKR